MKEYVLDANAVLRFFGVGSAEGRDKIRALFELAERDEARLIISAINLGEVCYVLLKHFGEQTTSEYLKTLQHTVTVVGIDQARAIEAASLKHGYKIGYADSFAAALALGNRATLVSADPSFEKFGKALKWVRLPPYVAVTCPPKTRPLKTGVLS